MKSLSKKEAHMLIMYRMVAICITSLGKASYVLNARRKCKQLNQCLSKQCVLLVAKINKV